MDDIRQTAIDRFRAYLERRQFSAHTVASYTLDLRLFFAEVAVPLAQVSFREVDQFVERQHQHGRAWATINRRLNALKHFFDFCLEQQLVRGNPVKPSHFVRRGRPLPKALSREQVQRLFAQIAHPMDRALFLVMLRCGLRVSEVAQLKLEQIDWEQQALHIVQGKGRKDRRVYMSPDAVASVQQCLEQHPGARAQGYVFWNRKRAQQPLSVKAIQKKMERYAKAAGITASCHSLRHTFASNLLEHGAEVVAIRDFLGHSQIASSERYAKISSQKIKQEYMRTMQKILEAGAGLRAKRGRRCQKIIYYKIYFCSIYISIDSCMEGTTDDRQATPPCGRPPRTAQPSGGHATAKQPVGRPKGVPSTIVNVRLPLTLVAQLDRYLDRLERQTGLKANRGMIARRALALFLASHASDGCDRERGVGCGIVADNRIVAHKRRRYGRLSHITEAGRLAP